MFIRQNPNAFMLGMPVSIVEAIAGVYERAH